MKTIITFLMAVLLTAQVQAGEGFDKLFSKYSDNEDVTTINMTEAMLKLAAKFLDDDNAEAREVISSIKSIKVLVSEGKNLTGMLDEALAVIKAGNYEELMRVNDEDEHIRISVVEDNDHIKDIVILVDSSDEFVLLNIEGDIDVNQVGKALKTLNIDIDGLNFEELESK